MREELIWSLKMEGVTENQINKLQVKDVRHSGVILVVDSNTGKKTNFLLSDRVNTKLIQFARNKKLEEFLFVKSNKNNNSEHKPKRTHYRKRVCFAE